MGHPETFAERLAFARRLAGITPNRLSVLAGLSRAHVSLLERGDRAEHVNLATASKISDALGIDLNWLANGSGDVPTSASIAEALISAEKRAARKPGTKPRRSRQSAGG